MSRKLVAGALTAIMFLLTDLPASAAGPPPGFQIPDPATQIVPVPLPIYEIEAVSGGRSEFFSFHLTNQNVRVDVNRAPSDNGWYSSQPTVVLSADRP